MDYKTRRYRRKFKKSRRIRAFREALDRTDIYIRVVRECLDILKGAVKWSCYDIFERLRVESDIYREAMLEYIDRHKGHYTVKSAIHFAHLEARWKLGQTRQILDEFGRETDINNNNDINEDDDINDNDI
jgi:hypothetical protein